ncbi:hypothetical protein EH240_35620 [Mesorhizobium tamadayense]|uniref:Uncharacterized protein n=1 Tax=Mesorhizobium tamadayense TaxID=425306 RepID=A0A3P3EN82_9HYPH|nr:hypothetical protein [Mesorhizobium tamadayense]RRH87859.1 hypothetical protein EH240_35620 [Mesorhizobium tamadayense]
MKLPALHDGHSPITLQQAFHEALEAIETCPDAIHRHRVSVEGRSFPVTEVVAAMLDCTDLVPMRTSYVLADLARRFDAPAPTGRTHTYGDWVGLVQRYCQNIVPPVEWQEGLA